MIKSKLDSFYHIKLLCFFIESCGYLPIFEPQFLQNLM